MARKQKKYHYLYKTTNNVTGKYYYGMHSTNDLNDGYFGSGKRLRYSINKYGKDNHSVEILEFVKSRKELIKREKEIVNLNEIAKDDCMNLMVGGKGGFISDEQQRKRAIAGGKATSEKLKNDIEFRNHFSRLSSNRMTILHSEGKIKYDTFRGKKHTNETIQIMREKRKGRGIGKENSQYGTVWITNGFENKKIKKDSIIPNGWYLGRKNY